MSLSSQQLAHTSFTTHGSLDATPATWCGNIKSRKERYWCFCFFQEGRRFRNVYAYNCFMLPLFETHVTTVWVRHVAPLCDTRGTTVCDMCHPCVRRVSPLCETRGATVWVCGQEERAGASLSLTRGRVCSSGELHRLRSKKVIWLPLIVLAGD